MLKYFLNTIRLILTIVLFYSCSKEETNKDFETEFNSIENLVLGYDWWGQRATWMYVDNLLSVYKDAMIFKNNDSIDIGYVGFGYGRHDLAKYYTLDTNLYAYSLKNNIISIQWEDSTIREWRIDQFTDTSLVISQLNNNKIFFLKFSKL